MDVYYAETRDINSRNQDFINCLSHDEKLKADKFHFSVDRETYISCHAMLRLVISRCLNIAPSEVSYKSGKNNKPLLKDNLIHFNITHTKEAFAFAVSREFFIGIDMEEINDNIDFTAIAGSYFSKKEQEYIFKSNNGTKNRFFSLWTRKESLLKALGVGIINKLNQVEVSEFENYINNEIFDDYFFDSDCNELFIYTKRLWNYSLSIAIPHKASIYFYHLNKENIFSYMN